MADPNSPPSRRRALTIGRRLAVVVVAIGLTACGTDGSDTIEIDAAIDDVQLVDATPSSPVALSDEESVLDMTLTNTGDEPEQIRYLRLEGEMLGLTFLTYTTRVEIELQPQESRTLTLPLDFFDVESQAHGYLRAQLALYGGDDGRELVGSEEFAVDVRGSATSTMALFAVLLVAVTAVSVVINLQGLARRTLPSNRFRRGAQFAVSGLGIGMVLTMAFSVLRVFPLPATAWWPLLVLPTGVAFAVGYVAPGRDDQLDEGDIDDLRDLDDMLTDIAD